MPTWQLKGKIPFYLSDGQLFKTKEEKWHRLAPRKSAVMKGRRAQEAVSDLSVIVKAMNIGLDNIEIAGEIEEEFPNMMETSWSTVEGIKQEIEQAVALMDGVLVSDESSGSV
jgi:hypothetical protein